MTEKEARRELPDVTVRDTDGKTYKAMTFGRLCDYCEVVVCGSNGAPTEHSAQYSWAAVAHAYTNGTTLAWPYRISHQ